MPTITLTLSTEQAQRVAAAFGRYWALADPDGTPRDATPAEVREYLARQLKGVVRQQDRRAAQAAAEADLPEEVEIT